jgi:hypothetical protein
MVVFDFIGNKNRELVKLKTKREKTFKNNIMICYFC